MATTLGCLLALDDVRRRHAIGKVLDLGTGSGVLAIAALKAGATMALGTDIDFDSVPVANENAKKNNVTGFTAMHVRGANHPRIRQAAPYDTVFANILMKPLIGLAPEIARLTAPGGTIILSGPAASPGDAGAPRFRRSWHPFRTPHPQGRLVDAGHASGRLRPDWYLPQIKISRRIRGWAGER